MIFKSYTDLAFDLTKWSDTLPQDIGLVVGVPRSGLLAACMLSLIRNVPVLDLASFLADRSPATGARPVGRGSRVLIVDDSVGSGRSIKEARSEVAHLARQDLLFGATYVTPQNTHLVDYYFQSIPQPRAFQWNVLYRPEISSSCMDFDGVLCRDPHPCENDNGVAYAEFLRSVPVKYRPPVPIGKIVSARLSSFRGPTEEWLSANGVPYDQLRMLDGVTADERSRLNAHAAFKAEVYRSEDHWLFVESDILQAREISRFSRRPVYSTDLSCMVYPNQDPFVQSPPRGWDRLAWMLGDQFLGMKERFRRMGSSR